MGFSPRSATFFAIRPGSCLILCLVMTLVPQVVQARDWDVPAQAPTIQAAIDSCVQGDVVVISPGVYTDCTNLSENVYHIGVLKSGVSLRGSTGNAEDVILDAERNGRCLEMRNLTGTVSIEALTLRRGVAVNPFGSGGGVFAYQSDPVFRHCVFDSNTADYAGGAICVLYGDLTVENCVFMANGATVLGGAIRASNSPVAITGTTIYGTTGEAIHYSVEPLTLDNCLITHGDQQAIVRNGTGDPDPVLTCTNLFGNDEDWSDFFSEQESLSGNLSVDPQYCNPLLSDMHLYVSSPCSEENNPGCGLIGALPVGCGTGSAVIVVRPDGMGDFPTIQDALNAAAIGDTVALADGTFTGDGNRNLDFLGKAITVMGQSGDPDLAIIDCQGSAAEPQRGFHFQNGEGVFSVLRDVTITNGDVPDDGAGILCESSPRIINCVFLLNHAERGAAIFCDGGSPEVRDCLVTRNEGRAQAGGMAFFGSTAAVIDCTITQNWGAQGSALFLPDSSTVTIEGCTVTGNNCALDRSMVGVDGNSVLLLDRTIISYGNHHAVRCFDQGTLTLTDCNVFGNADSDYSICIIAMKGNDGNISADPRYCDAAGDDLTLRGDSPCAAINAWGGELVGAHGVGCAAPSSFVDVSSALAGPETHSGGVSLVDIDSDGNQDIFVANQGGRNEIYLGDGAGGFSALAEPVLEFAAPTATGAWGDWDNDGDFDLYLGNMDLLNLLVENDQGVYSYLTIDNIGHEGPAGGSVWLDYDGDGHLDLFVAATDSSSTLLRNDGAGGLLAADAFASIITEGVQHVAPADYDKDGDLDFYLVQDGAPNQLVENMGDDDLQVVALINNDGAGRGAAWGDYDNDKDLDLYLVNDGGENFLFQNRNGNAFDDKSQGILKDIGPGRSGIWGDWDNDGDLDLFLANCGASDRLLRNEGDGLFVDVADPVFAAPDSSTGAAWGDWDNDGDLDLVVADQSGATRLYRNDPPAGNHWLEVDLIHYSGAVGCPGAKVRIVTDGNDVQIREVGAGGGWLSQNATTVHFGLGEVAVIDSVKVTLPGCWWPPLIDVAADQKVVITATNASPVFDPDFDLPGARAPGLYACYPNPFNPSTTIRFGLASAGWASMTIYDVAGRLMRVLFDESRAAGLQSVVWNGRDQSDRAMASGVYFIRLESQDVHEVRSVVLLK
jgi:FG-GAP-like repeat/ASPIC and UnbV/Right handed beta helix region/FlgD Ig-like domain